MPSLSVTQGIIHVNSVYSEAVHDDAIVLVADCRQKRPEIGYYAHEDGTVAVALGADENTIGVEDREAASTVITVSGLDGDWRIFAEASRYTVMICLSKIPPSERETFALEWGDGE